MKAREDWRNDPERRAAAAAMHAAWIDALNEAEPHIRAAYDVLVAAPNSDRGGMAALVRGIRRDLFTALNDIRHVSRKPASDTLIGDMAAFGEGMEL